MVLPRRRSVSDWLEDHSAVGWLVLVFSIAGVFVFNYSHPFSFLLDLVLIGSVLAISFVKFVIYDHSDLLTHAQ
jgi:hypothetical protein